MTNATVLLATNGDANAFGQLYQEHAPMINGYLAKRLNGDHATAEDITAQTFLKAWQAIDRYKPGVSAFKAWPMKIAMNLLADHYRRGKPSEYLEEEVHDQANPDPADFYSDSETSEHLQAAINRLRPEQRAVIVLRFMHGLSHQEISNRIGLNIGQCRVIQHRALATLRRLMTEE